MLGFGFGLQGLGFRVRVKGLRLYKGFLTGVKNS